MVAAPLSFWIVGALDTGLTFSAVVLFGALFHLLAIKRESFIDGPWFVAGYVAYAVATGLVPLVAMPAGINAQAALLLATLVSMPLISFALSAHFRAASSWVVVTAIVSSISWLLAPSQFDSLFPQVVLLSIACLSLAVGAQGAAQQRALAEALVDARTNSQIDTLTGLYRRTAFMQMIEESLRSDGDACLFFIDIDRFKVVNDTLGHQAGDQLLTAVAGRVRGALRGSDYAGRMGGDEIAVFVHGSSPDVALEIAARLGRLFEQDFQLLHHSVAVAASIGLVCAKGGDRSAVELVHHADTAMYAAKRDGQVVRLFDSRMHADLLQVEETELDLRASLRRGDVGAYLQPIVDASRGEIVGFEALGRWHRSGAVVPAADFFASAEQSNLLPEVTRAVAGDIVDLSQRLSPVPMVGVNVEAGDLGRFLDWLAMQPVDLTRWVVELTENQVVDNYAEADRDVRRAAAMGVGVILDDFGKGYSSLTRILRLPIMGLKIDRSFVAEMLHNETARAIVSSAVHLASECELIVIAEGVETAEQTEALLDMGVRLMQGYHFHRPAEIEASIELLSTTTPRRSDAQPAVERRGQPIG